MVERPLPNWRRKRENKIFQVLVVSLCSLTSDDGVVEEHEDDEGAVEDGERDQQLVERVRHLLVGRDLIQILI